MARVCKNGGLIIVYDFWGMGLVKKIYKKFGVELQNVIYANYIPFSKIMIFKKPEEGIKLGV
jgi:hypothetical protein